MSIWDISRESLPAALLILLTNTLILELRLEILLKFHLKEPSSRELDQLKDFSPKELTVLISYLTVIS